MNNYHFGWIPEEGEEFFNPNDLFMTNQNGIVKKINKLELNMPSVYNQGSIGSCTANAISNIIRYQNGCQKDKKKSLTPK